MRLRDLIQDLPDARVIGDAAIEVGEVRDDSRAVAPGDVFVAVRGRTVDGHAFAPAAADKGAAAVVVEAPVDVDVPQVVVPSGVRALGWLAARAAGRPTDRMRMIAVTGTNGKTTTTYLLESILRAAGCSPGVVGTVSFRYGGKETPATFTTPAPVELQRLFAEMAAAGTTDVVMETSSAALAMDRLAGVTFAAGAFTNLTQDHLDVHVTMEAYFEAKARLFAEHVAGVAVANIDDPRGEDVLARAPAGVRRIRVSTRGEADVSVARSETTIAGISATVRTPGGELAIRSPLLGDYNLANIALAAAVADALGIPGEAIRAGVEALRGVPGRVERIPNPRRIDAFVDYAHTPDALERVIAALRKLTRGRLIVAFGCGGDRDPGKRPKMGRAVARDADIAIVTSDNPRTEDPAAIVEMIRGGVRQAATPELSLSDLATAPRGYVVEVDRRIAIRLAMEAAQAGDVVLIAGKGHEDYQIIGRTKVHFDDREEAARALPPVLTLEEIVAATHGEVVAAEEPAFYGASIDGRTARPGDLFAAVQGERFDGHDFLSQAAASGATGFLVSRTSGTSGVSGTVVKVPDVRVGLGQLGRLVRRRWGGPLVGVTGSSGKTTTKDLIGAMLGDGALMSEGSLNNETGVPLTLLRLRPWHRSAVVEMGMRGLGHIEYLAQIAEPDVGVVVNAGSAHVGVVGSAEAIARGKSEIWLHTAGAAVYPHDDARLRALAIERGIAADRHVTFGEAAGAAVRLVSYEPRTDGSDAEYVASGRQIRVRVPLVGRHNAGNAACALAVAVALGLDLDAAAQNLEGARPSRHRSEVADIGGRHVILDCYNANPASMTAALRTLAEQARGARGVAILGDMRELGPLEEQEHDALGRLVHQLGVDRLITMGEAARVTARAARAAGVGHVEIINIDCPEEAARLVASWTSPGDWILIKASRAMRLERVADALREVVG
ncbi:MAG TPA: UDP-N-acetylmuramoyl-L-alanyl-D-glutamate--2,6-diaminopimelate ligase [Haliangiales bacterium]|nr:UDP-N-acetylmuramoyl-L-alanyl-D-glutamate--2,6-diaminopimelate ligase [Haliangiales bacterium]